MISLHPCELALNSESQLQLQSIREELLIYSTA